MDSGKIKKMRMIQAMTKSVMRSKRIMNWTNGRENLYRHGMDSHHTNIRQNTTSEAELEILIAKYTLEYLYRWTNHFDPVQLAQIKHLLDAGEEPKMFLNTMDRPGSGLQS